MVNYLVGCKVIFFASLFGSELADQTEESMRVGVRNVPTDLSQLQRLKVRRLTFPNSGWHAGCLLS